jgi:hypothetical protein
MACGLDLATTSPHCHYHPFGLGSRCPQHIHGSFFTVHDLLVKSVKPPLGQCFRGVGISHDWHWHSASLLLGHTGTTMAAPLQHYHHNDYRDH